MYVQIAYIHLCIHVVGKRAQPAVLQLSQKSSYWTLIEVHELHGQMHPNQRHVTKLFAVDPLSLFGYLTSSCNDFPIKTLVARQGQTNGCTCNIFIPTLGRLTCTCTCTLCMYSIFYMCIILDPWSTLCLVPPLSSGECPHHLDMETLTDFRLGKCWMHYAYTLSYGLLCTCTCTCSWSVRVYTYSLFFNKLTFMCYICCAALFVMCMHVHVHVQCSYMICAMYIHMCMWYNPFLTGVLGVVVEGWCLTHSEVGVEGGWEGGYHMVQRVAFLPVGTSARS